LTCVGETLEALEMPSSHESCNNNQNNDEKTKEDPHLSRRCHSSPSHDEFTCIYLWFYN